MTDICERALQVYGQLNFPDDKFDFIKMMDMQSPIEQIMFVILDALPVIDMEYAEYSYGEIDSFPSGTYRTWQYKIGNYIADFMLKVVFEGKIICKIAIECDGHDFHEKTKEQAQKDKERDRFFQQEGYFVFRYTGSEIYKHPEKILEEVNGFICDKVANG